jgi:hypothetical protein
MLKSMPSIVRFISRWNKGIRRINGADLKPIHLRHLKIFELEAFPSEIYTILQPLIFPLLTDLTIVTTSTTVDSSMYTLLADSVVSAISHSSCRLTSLSLRSVDSACVSRILQHTRSVKNLELGYIQSAQIILEQLVWPSSLVPRLRSFALECKVDQGVTCIGPLISVIRSRSYSDDQGAEGRLRMVNLTLREKRGVDPFAVILIRT